MSSLAYTPLGLDEKGRPEDLQVFRLLRLHAGEGDEIACELFTADFEDETLVDYEALSYCWGSQNLFSSIEINGINKAITDSLYLALWHLRSKHNDRILWVDAVCIDQGNSTERTHQIKQMKNIYSRAERVLFWLGSGTKNSDLLLENLTRFDQRCRQYPSQQWGPEAGQWEDIWNSVYKWNAQGGSSALKEANDAPDWAPTADAAQASDRPDLLYLRDGLEHLLSRDWFKRVWVLQEVANARRGLICSGTKSVPSRAFALAPNLLEVAPEPHCQALLDMMPGPSRSTSWWADQRDLYTLLTRFYRSQSTDPRDMIYGILGLCTNSRDLSTFEPDYGVQLSDLVATAAEYFFGAQPEGAYDSIQSLIQAKYELNTDTLVRLVEAGDLLKIEDLFRWRPDEFIITEEVLLAAIKHGNQMEAFTEEGYEEGDEGDPLFATSDHEEHDNRTSTALGHSRQGIVKKPIAIMNCLREQCKKVKGVMNNSDQNQAKDTWNLSTPKSKNIKSGWSFDVTRKMVHATDNSTLIYMLERDRFSSEALRAVVEKRGAKVIEVLLRTQQLPRTFQGQQIIVTAATNHRNILEQIMTHQGAGIMVPESVLIAAAGNEGCGISLVKALLGKRCRITENVIVSAVRNLSWRMDLLEPLLRAREKNLEINSNILCAAAFPVVSSCTVIVNKFFDLRAEETVEALINSPKVLISVLLYQQSSSGKTISQVIEAVVKELAQRKNRDMVVQRLTEDYSRATASGQDPRMHVSYDGTTLQGQEQFLYLYKHYIDHGVFPPQWESAAELRRAVIDGNWKFQKLIEEKSSPDTRDILRATPLHHAARLGRKEFVRILSELDTVKINSQCSFNRTPLFWSIYAKDLNSTKLLLSQGARQDYEDQNGTSPLALAQYMGSSGLVNILILDYVGKWSNNRETSRVHENGVSLNSGGAGVT